MKTARFGLILILLFSHLELFAQKRPREPGFGMEITATKRSLTLARLKYPGTADDTTTNEGLAIQSKIAKYIRTHCPGCKVEAERDKWEIRSYRVIFPDGWEMQITLDPDVIEFIGKPIYPSDYKVMMPRLESFLFDAYKSENLKPMLNGGGHIHVGIESGFDFDPLLFRNFVVDIFNHPEFAAQLFYIDFESSPSIMERSFKELSELKNILSEYDELLLEYATLPKRKKKSRGIELIRWFAKQMEARVYTSTSVEGWELGKSQSVSFSRISARRIRPENWTLELRFFRPQRTAKEFFVLIEMLKRRIEFLKTKTQPLAFEAYEYQHAKAAEKTERFVRYLNEIKMNPKDFEDIVRYPYLESAPKTSKWPRLFQDLEPQKNGANFICGQTLKN